MRVVTNPHNRIEETTQFTCFFTTVGNGKSVPVNPTVNARATRAKVYELGSTCLPKEWEKREPELPSIFPTTATCERNYRFVIASPWLSQYPTAYLQVLPVP